ncbi:class I SAM-dependent methyltransferase [Halomicroarcula sp. S1AR25-4]|uniref:class I SAM-dependent methyltransferase n=1 Tax=Haloarcula sp. S1AR25-4 TaxID=2950538 RepID=UPI0028754B57|nr:class I SAM-dependent methyltransferase [Halomicroarcula sp. S1AR25-4]MDS0279787.1 class I SAM-dependent methyltransferase [Halomicroarcula sp. S1AR25-4]
MHAAKGFFDKWAAFYDDDYEEQAIGDVEFYVDLARRVDGPVLEVGCGTGRIYLELLQAGVDAYGIDISEEMLDVLKRKAADAGLTPNVWQADMTDFTPQREYALVIVPFRTFLHNITVADQQAALQNFHQALGSDGRLALNFFVPSFEVICESYGEPETRTFTQDGKEYVVTDVTDIENEIEQIVKAERTVKHDDEVLQEATFRLTLISKTEFELLLGTTGWSNWTGYSGFEREPLDDGAKEMVWIAEK